MTVTSQAANPISGAYTINSALPTAGTNFISFTDAAARLNQDGISGPVTLTVSGGPYTEQFLLGDAASTSATSTIVVNGSGRTIRYASTSTTQRAVVQLNGTDCTTVNNLNIDATGGSGTSGTYGYGVLLTNADDQAAAANITDGIYNSGVSADVRNNVVSITRPSPGTKYGLHYSTAPTTSNYNDIYVPNGNVGYFGTALVTLTNLQTATSSAFDQNSVSADPVFAGASTGNLLPGNVPLNNAGTPLTRVTDDITGATRGAAPDPGAYEFTPVGVDVAPVALLDPATGTSCYSAAEAVIVQIRNASTSALNFAATPATVAAVATLPGGTTQTFLGTVSTGTLTSGAALGVILTGTLNMTTLSAYAVAVTATVMGDANTANNVLTPAATRTVAAPVAGALSPAVFTICVSGSTSLALAGASNGTVQYQSTSDGTYTILNTVATSDIGRVQRHLGQHHRHHQLRRGDAHAHLDASGRWRTANHAALAGVTYQFFRNGVAVAGTSNTLLLPVGSQNGSYTVVVTSTAGCASVLSNAVSVTVTSTQTAALVGVSLLVYSNPTPNGSLTLELRDPRATASQPVVLNPLCQVMHTRTIAAGSASLNLASLAAGVYTFRMETTEGGLTQRVVRE